LHRHRYVRSVFGSAKGIIIARLKGQGDIFENIFDMGADMGGLSWTEAFMAQRCEDAAAKGSVHGAVCCEDAAAPSEGDGTTSMSENADIRFGTDGWRAVIADGFTYDRLRRVADATGRVFAAEHPGATILVGYDTRFQAPAFAQAVAEVIASHGLVVKLSDRYIPTPGVCWSIARDADAQGGVILTASHNPASYLGLKIRMADGGASPVAFTDWVEAALREEVPAPCGADSAAGIETVDMVDPYLAQLAASVDAEAIASARLKILVDPLYGAARGYLADTLEGLGIEVSEIHGFANPGFGGLHPEPIPPHTGKAQARVGSGGFDAAFVTDGDADRIGAIDALGNFVDPHRIICLIARHLAEDRGAQGSIVKTVSTSVLVDRLGAHLGRKVITTPIGFKWVYGQMLAGDVMIGGEESGGIGIPGHVRERDALLMALLLAEMMGQRRKTLGELVEELFEVTGRMEYSRHDMRLVPGADMDALKRGLASLERSEVAGLPVLGRVTLDGVRFDLPDDAWLLLRASGTEPLVRVYAEAPDTATVDALIAVGCGLVDTLADQVE